MKHLATLNKYFVKYKKLILTGLVFIVLSNWFGAFPAQIVRKAFDLVKEDLTTYQALTNATAKEALLKSFGLEVLKFGGLVILVALIKGVFMYFMRQTIVVMSRHVEYDLKNDIYAHYQRLNVAFYRRNNTGDLMNRITEDVSRVRMYIGPAVMYIANLFVMFCLIIPIMVSVNGTLTFWALVPLPFLALSIYFLQNTINTQSETIQEKLSSISTFTQENFSGIRVIKSFTREKDILNKFEAEAEGYQAANMKMVRTHAYFYPLVTLLISLSVLLTVYVGSLEMRAGRITIGNIAEFLVYVNMLTWPIITLGWVSSQVQRAAVSQRRINEFLTLAPEIVNAAEPIHISKIQNIAFKNVSFTYPDTGIKAINNISFEIHLGQTLSIIGQTGSGKSTIAYLISRMYDIDSGEILINNIPIKQIDIQNLRENISVVLQEAFLFSDTIKNNIGFGLDTLKDTDIYNAATQADVFDNIMAFEHKFDTMVGERGITLSGGQKQRSTIARAIAPEPSVMVLDDALSAVDTQTENTILNNLKAIQAKHINIIIAHRISAVQHADTIIVLENGTIKESGNHTTLLAHNGYYKRMYNKQLLEMSV